MAIVGQIFFLVMFSYSFFIKGFTGLTVAIGSVATLAILMKVTAAVDWEDVFKMIRRPRRQGKPPVTVPQEDPVS